MRVTCIQLEIKDRPPRESLAHALRRIDEARGSDLVLLPELWPCGYFAFDRYAAESEPADGPIVQALIQKAREINAWLLIGSFVERQDDRLYNTALLIDPRGAVAGKYRKMHLFGYQSREPELLTSGDEVMVVPTPWGRAGLSICYDLRFPELYRRMLDQGADFFLVAAAWPAGRVETWTLLNRCRAMENQTFVFAANGAGTSDGVRLGGHSLLVDPWGRVLAEGGDGEALVTAEIEPSLVQSIRQEFPALRDRRLK